MLDRRGVDFAFTYAATMHSRTADWENRVLMLWKALDEYSPEDFIAKIESLAGAISHANLCSRYGQKNYASTERTQAKIALP